jgi:toxin YoeB
MEYDVIFLAQAEKQIKALKRDTPHVHEKLLKLVSELRKNPEIGTGHPKPLGYGFTGCYSRRITQKHRLIYQINEEKKVVIISSVHGHYDDK